MHLLLQDLASAKPTAARAEMCMVKKACVIFESIHAARNPSLNAARRAVLKVILAQVIAFKKLPTLAYLKEDLEMHSLSKEMYVQVRAGTIAKSDRGKGAASALARRIPWRVASF